MTPDLQAFLERYRDAFNALDGDAVAALYAEPSGIAQGGRYTLWPDHAAVAANMQALCRMYRERGFRSASFTLRHLLPLGRHDAMVDVAWRIEWAHGAEPWCFATAYHLMRSDDRWLVRQCIAHEEDLLWQDADATPWRDAGAPSASVDVAPLLDASDAGWMRLRRALWPDGEPSAQLEEMASQLAEPGRFAQFIARDDQGAPLGLVEVSLRHDYVPGTETSPVVFLEGLFVEPLARQRGIARLLVAAAEAWGAARGCTEMASDTPISNGLSQTVHRHLGFVESERIVCFHKRLREPGERA